MAKQKNTKHETTAKVVKPSMNIPTRGRTFQGFVTKKFAKRVVIEFERTVYIKKYERFFKKKTKLHARLPDAMINDIHIGDYIKVRETRPLSKIIRFLVIEKVRAAGIKQATPVEPTLKVTKVEEKAK